MNQKNLCILTWNNQNWYLNYSIICYALQIIALWFPFCDFQQSCYCFSPIIYLLAICIFSYHTFFSNARLRRLKLPASVKSIQLFISLFANLQMQVLLTAEVCNSKEQGAKNSQLVVKIIGLLLFSCDSEFQSKNLGFLLDFCSKVQWLSFIILPRGFHFVNARVQKFFLCSSSTYCP